MRVAAVVLFLGGALPGCSAPPQLCRPIPAADGPTIVVRRVGGNIRPTGVAIFADGRVQSADTSAAAMPLALPARVSAASVASIAADAHRGEFWTLPASPTRRPTEPADEARRSIAIHLTCGSHDSTYPENAEPAAFQELLGRIEALLRR